ncbi:methyltransferase family protein [Veronia pacifica]|uniref:Protein-S-isoprenylcysteine methyltransferase n=2 Tax=Veronia pacifica TaxID=1080227 RepID=A0A1C3ESR7_9GAMM|nr:isoprenylcysteine carboxylmethyltransferase family protein [Veronia pacifica]ODA36249.1 hypothetical protein A8L45_01220 [Veronia pacifica]
MKFLELKIPPLFLVVICITLMWWINGDSLGVLVTLSYRLAASVILLLAAILCCYLGVREFAVHKTTVDPMHPDSSSQLVQSGIYQYTRNPMYVGFALLLLAAAVFLGHPIALLFVPLFMIYMTIFQIKPEEVALTQLFGSSYTDYTNKVRRWL